MLPFFTFPWSSRRLIVKAWGPRWASKRGNLKNKNEVHIFVNNKVCDTVVEEIKILNETIMM